MTQTCKCPHCGETIWPQPFIGHAWSECPYCGGSVVLSTDGLSFETSRIRATRPVNGECSHCPIVGVSAPSLG